MVGARSKILAEHISYRVLATDGGLPAIAARFGTTPKAIWMASARLRAWRNVTEADFYAKATAGQSVVMPIPASEREWEWEYYKPKESKLLDVCAARNKDPVAAALRAGMPPLTPAFLFRLLMNGPLREAALKAAKDPKHLDQHPEEVTIPADTVLMIPYPIHPVAGVIAAPPNPPGAAPAAPPAKPDGEQKPAPGPAADDKAPGDGAKVVTVAVRAPSDTDPPQGSIYELIPQPLRVTLGRSFRHRVLNLAGTGQNLRAAFDAQPAPATTWEALDRLSATDINTLVRLYERVIHIEAALWKQIQYVRFGWFTSSQGWAMVWVDRDAFTKALGDTSGLCSDTIIGERWHQSKWYAFDCDCWREIVDSSDREGIHFCIAKIGTDGDDNIHIDEVDPASSSDLFDRCEYDLSASIPHLAMVGANQGVKNTPFYAVDLAIAEGWKLVRAPALAGTEKGKSLSERLTEKETHWNGHARAIGCMGKKGFEIANAILDKVNDLVREAQEATKDVTGSLPAADGAAP